MRALPRLSHQFKQLFVRTLLSNYIVLMRRDVQDHLLLRFLPVLNQLISSVELLDEIVSMATLFENAHKIGFASLMPSKVRQVFC